MRGGRRYLFWGLTGLTTAWFAWRTCPCVLTDLSALGGGDDAIRINSLPHQCTVIRMPEPWIDANGNSAEAGVIPPYCELRKGAALGEYLLKLASQRRFLPFRPPTEYSRSVFGLRLLKGPAGELTVTGVRRATEVEWEQATYVAPPDRPYEDYPHAEENGGPTVQGKQYPLAESMMAWSMDGMISFDWRFFSVATYTGPAPGGGGGLGLNFTPHPWRHWLVVDFFQLGDPRSVERIKGWTCRTGLGHAGNMNWQVDNIWMMPLRRDHRDLLVCKF